MMLWLCSWFVKNLSLPFHKIKKMRGKKEKKAKTEQCNVINTLLAIEKRNS